ncbi:FkbM family methyltransferase, partial [Amycolatopsis sp. NPDC059021]|uniref:FkbM family methyltransferase n=1 Tax=Amycolatopsis sp. NPDC059021 TaxID=3346704 RepID=UPI00366BFDF8
HVTEAHDHRNMEAAKRGFGVTDAGAREGFMNRSRSDAVEFSVPVTTLAKIFADYAVTEAGLLKVDVERAELEVLRGLDDSCWPKIRTVVTEVHDLDGRLAAVVNLLRAKGFTVDGHQQDAYRGGSTHLVTATRTWGGWGAGRAPRPPTTAHQH